MVKWSILIVAVSERTEKLCKLCDQLAKQLQPGIEVLVCLDNFEYTVGQKRQALLEAAKGEYISFVDDDDWVPDYYVEKILPLLDGVDYIGWRQQLIHDGQMMKPTFHSLKHPVSEDENAWYRNVSHLNPLKRSIAIQGNFDKTPQLIAEDAPWAEQIAHLPKTEHYIKDVMYFYWHSTEGSLWDKKPKPLLTFTKPKLPKGFSYVYPRDIERQT